MSYASYYYYEPLEIPVVKDDKTLLEQAYDINTNSFDVVTECTGDNQNNNAIIESTISTLHACIQLLSQMDKYTVNLKMQEFTHNLRTKNYVESAIIFQRLRKR